MDGLAESLIRIRKMQGRKMFEHKTEEEARKEILNMVRHIVISIMERKMHLHRENGFHMLRACMIMRRCAAWWTVHWNSG